MADMLNDLLARDIKESFKSWGFTFFPMHGKLIDLVARSLIRRGWTKVQSQ